MTDDEGPREEFNERWCPNGCGTVLAASATHFGEHGYSCRPAVPALDVPAKTPDPATPWAADDDGDHSAFTHRDDDEEPPYRAKTPEPATIGTTGHLSIAKTPDPATALAASAPDEDDCHNRTHIALDDARDEIERLKAARPAVPALDVERLRRAWMAHNGTGECTVACHGAIAREYAALSEKRP